MKFTLTLLTFALLVSCNDQRQIAGEVKCYRSGGEGKIGCIIAPPRTSRSLKAHAIFGERQDNGQFCLYKKRIDDSNFIPQGTSSRIISVSDLEAVQGKVSLVNPMSVNPDDLISALHLEQTYRDYAQELHAIKQETKSSCLHPVHVYRHTKNLTRMRDGSTLQSLCGEGFAQTLLQAIDGIDIDEGSKFYHTSQTAWTITSGGKAALYYISLAGATSLLDGLRHKLHDLMREQHSLKQETAEDVASIKRVSGWIRSEKASSCVRRDNT